MAKSPSAMSATRISDIDTGESSVWVVIFSADGEHLLSGGSQGLRVWSAGDGQPMATVETPDIVCLAVSKNSRHVAGGTYDGHVIVWHAATYAQAFKHRESAVLYGVDFSPDSTRLLAASWNFTVSVLDIATGEQAAQVSTLRHRWRVVAAKYSPQGDRIATATPYSVHVWDSSDGQLLMDIPVTVTPRLNNGGLLWSQNDSLFVIVGGAIKQLDTSTGSETAEWPVSDTSLCSCLALPEDGNFLAYSTQHSVSFWDMGTHTLLGRTQDSVQLRSIAFSPNGQYFAIGRVDGKIVVKDAKMALPSSYSTAVFVDIPATALKSWKQGLFADTEISLTGIISSSTGPIHHALASRALVRSHLCHWDTAIDDAENSIKTRPSVIGYVAKSVALIGGGQKEEGCRVFDLAFRYCEPIHLDHLLLIKVVVLFMAGKRNDALSRIGDLISTLQLYPEYYLVQAYMHFLLGCSHLENSNYQNAIHWFVCARTYMRNWVNSGLFDISLISGWRFDELGVTLRQRLCEALYAAGRTKDAGELLLELANTLDDEGYTSGPITEWITGLTQRFLATPEISIPILIEWVKAALATCSWKDVLASAAGFTVPRLTVYRIICERLQIADRITEAIECFHQMSDESTLETTVLDDQAKWIGDFKHRCAEKLKQCGDKAANAEKYDDAITQYSAALSLGSTISQDILTERSKVYVSRGFWEQALDDIGKMRRLDPSTECVHETELTEWAKVNLTCGSWKDALATAAGLEIARFARYRFLCEYLETLNRLAEAAECLREMEMEISQEMHRKEVVWVLEFKSRCCRMLEDFGDSAMNVEQLDEAISRYSAVLSLVPTTQRLFIKRSMAYIARGSWKQALRDVSKAIKSKLLLSTPFAGKSRKGAFYRARPYEDAIDAFGKMLSEMPQSSDLKIRDRHRHYMNTRMAIQEAVQDAINDSPRVLINIASGKLLDKSAQASAFESLPIFHKMVCSMMTRIDHERITHYVTEYYRYAMFSHKWEDNEPLFGQVMCMIVYDLEESPTNDKLRRFCEVVRATGLHWAWSDNCCINKADHFVLQEALVAMFKWYKGSTLTVVYLRDAPLRSLVESIWNSRAWTFQEYHASKVVRFYNADWTLYMGLDIPNHKESHEIISEMEKATGISAQALIALQPGLNDIREKLSLASTRQTTLVEDAAYSLLGIFSMSLPVVYGEGDQALGKLLAQLLMSSGDTSILAWTGTSGSFNSCLPGSITVFKEFPTSYIPRAVTDVEMETITTRLIETLPHCTPITKFYSRLNELRVPSFSGKRMTLPCLVFKLGPLESSQCGAGAVFRASTAALGTVEIKAKEDLSRFKSLYLANPWIDFLLDRCQSGCTFDELAEEKIHDSDQSSMVLQADVRALRVLARVRQAFGALLLTPSPGGVAAYRRVAPESLITVQVQEITPTILETLIDSVRVLDVL